MGLHNLKIQSFYQSCERFIHLLFDGLIEEIGQEQIRCKLYYDTSEHICEACR